MTVALDWFPETKPRLICTLPNCGPTCDRLHACEFCRSYEHESQDCPTPYSCERCGGMVSALYPVQDSDPSVGYDHVEEMCAECREAIQ